MASLLRDISKRLGTSSPTLEKRLIFVGTRASSKTTALGCLDLTCDVLSAQDPNFTHFIDEKTSGIRQVPSDLCQGYFPEPTPPGLIYEADEIMRWKTSFGERKVCLPFCETAGEDIESFMGPFGQSVYHQNVNYQSAENLNKYICDSNGYVLVVPVSRAHLPGVPQMDEESGELLKDPDVNIARILSAIYRYKAKSRSPAIEGIAVLLTKYDMIEAYVKSRGMDLYNNVGARQFLETYFRQTSALLKFYGLQKVRFFPVHVQVEKGKLPDGNITYLKHPSGRGYKIMLDHDRNLPIYSEQSYLNLIQWVKETFAR
jgi:hypothetical protein